MSDYADEIESMQVFSKTELPRNAADIQKDLSRTVSTFPRAAELLADIEGLIVTMRAVETLSVKRDRQYEELTGPERKTQVEARLVNLVRVRDILRATVTALNDRSFALRNQRNYEGNMLRMTPAAEG